MEDTKTIDIEDTKTVDKEDTKTEEWKKWRETQAYFDNKRKCEETLRYKFRMENYNPYDLDYISDSDPDEYICM